MRAARRKRSGRLSVDGTSFRRRHRYVTVVSNPETGHVLHVAPGGGARTCSWRSTRTWERSNRAAGESFSMDMWEPYISATLTLTALLAVADGSRTCLRRARRTRLRPVRQPTLRGHTPCVSRRGWRGAVPPVTPTTETARCERRTRRLGEGPRQRRGACRVARQGALRRLDPVGSGAPLGRPGAYLDRAARRGGARAHAGGGARR